MRDRPLSGRLWRLAPHVILTTAVIFTFIPITWMLGLSVKPPAELYTDVINPLPRHATLDNYRDASRALDLGRQFLNSVIFAGGQTAGQVLIGIPAAWAVSQFRFPGRNLLFALLLITMTVPFVVLYVPNYLLMARLGLLNTYQGMILPQLAGAFAVFLLRQHFQVFPREILDAARLDGASDWRVLWGIMVPASRATLSALVIFLFISGWNEYIWPLLIAPDRDMHVLTVGTASFAGEGGTNWGPTMAATTIATVPALIVYLVVRRQLQALVSEGALRG